jgi:hypothetical protein
MQHSPAAQATLQLGLCNCPMYNLLTTGVLNTCLVENCTVSTQHGLKGNRAVSGSVWSVVTAATRAFPIQLSPSVEKAQTVAEGCAGADLVQTWVLQVIGVWVLERRMTSQPRGASCKMCMVMVCVCTGRC